MTTNRNRGGTPSRSQRRQFLKGAAGLAAGSAAALVMACGGDGGNRGTAPSGGVSPQPTAAAAAATQAPKRGGRLGLNHQDSTTGLNPVTDTGQRLAMAAILVYDRLVTNRLDKEYVLEAAQSVEQPDPTTIVFKLRPGLTFQNLPPVNGRAVTADDIVASQHYVRDETRAINATFQRTSMQSVEAPDAQTVVFKLKGPNAYVFSGTHLVDPSGSCIFPAEILGTLINTCIGSGPYQLTEYAINERYLYKRFAGYRDADKGLPYIEEREYFSLKDPAAQEAAFRSEQVSLWTLPDATFVDRIKQQMGGRIEVEEYETLGFMALLANITKPPWNDVRVREALYRITNRKQYLDLLEQGRGKIPPGPLSYGLSAYRLDPQQTEKYFRQDAMAARQLLSAAGFDPNREVEITQINRQRDGQAAEIMQQQLATVGIKTRVTSTPFAEWLQQRIPGNQWETFVTTFPGWDTPQAPLRLQHTETGFPHRYSGLKDPEVDKMIEKSEVTLDRNERIKLVKEIQIQLLEKYTPFIYVYTPTNNVARWKYVRDYEVDPSSNPRPRPEMWLDK